MCTFNAEQVKWLEDRLTQVLMRMALLHRQWGLNECGVCLTDIEKVIDAVRRRREE